MSATVEFTITITCITTAIILNITVFANRKYHDTQTLILTATYVLI